MRSTLLLCLLLAWLGATELMAQPYSETLSVTQHAVTVNGQKLNYTATCGYLPLRSEEGEERAWVFFTAYTKNGVSDLSERPICYTFNGGPGSSSTWLHMGGLGPKRPDSGGLII